VLELGPATGHFTFFLEHNGADVVSFEVGYDTSIDLLPPVTQEDIEPLRSTLMTQLERVNNSWWYLHQDRGSAAKIVYGNIYELPSDLGSFDDSFVGSILLHLQNPFLALQQASRHTSKRMIVTDMVYGDLDDPTYLTRIANADSPPSLQIEELALSGGSSVQEASSICWNALGSRRLRSPSIHSDTESTITSARSRLKWQCLRW
jgi:hypothetical protein